MAFRPSLWAAPSGARSVPVKNTVPAGKSLAVALEASRGAVEGETTRRGAASATGAVPRKASAASAVSTLGAKRRRCRIDLAVMDSQA